MTRLRGKHRFNVVHISSVTLLSIIFYTFSDCFSHKFIPHSAINIRILSNSSALTECSNPETNKKIFVAVQQSPFQI